MTHAFIAHIAQLLNQHAVKYAVTGGVAQLLTGSAKATFDLDLLIDRSPENIQSVNRFIEALTGTRLDISDQVNRQEIIRINTFPFPIDLLPKLDGLSNEAVFDRSTTLTVHEIPIPVISEQDLHINYTSISYGN